MKLQDLKQQIQEFQYFEDTSIIDVSLASIVATRLSLGDPVWLIIIGASSGGKSQILRPLALTDNKFIHRVDDLTENTFLSGAAVKGKDNSLLTRIGQSGILVISDLTVLFSKNKDARSAILSQIRMIYDGEMIKYVGTKDKPIEWKGSLGVLAGSTPSIYSHFEEVADMGERFIYWRMKGYDPLKATRLSMQRGIYGKELDNKLSAIYETYLKELIQDNEIDKNIELSDNMKDTIMKISVLAEKIRTTVHTDWNKAIDKIPVPAMPMRVALQLTAIARALSIMRKAEGKELGTKDEAIIEWCGYSLANEEKRACLRFLAGLEYGDFATTQIVADKIGLSTSTIGNVLQNLASVGILIREGGNSGLTWRINNKEDWETIRRIEGIEDIKKYEDRIMTGEEIEERDVQRELEMF